MTELDSDGSASSGSPTLPKDYRRLKLDSGWSPERLRAGVEECRALILETDRCSDERKWLVRHLVELRLRLRQIEDSEEGVTCVVAGHHFRAAVRVRSAQCERCGRPAWSAYRCVDCGFSCHPGCADGSLGVCAHVLATETARLNTDICPQRGLAAQRYRCAECDAPLPPRAARLCDYSGLHYCPDCHWNDECDIPARVLHNWDWSRRPVSRSAFHLLRHTRTAPLLDLRGLNRKLFLVVTEAVFVQKLRDDLKTMTRYLVECRLGAPLVDARVLRLTETPDLYSMEDLEAVRDGRLERRAAALVERCRDHITACEVCRGKGYVCELCDDDEVFFPFDSSASGCDGCNSHYHRACWIKTHRICPKCVRIRQRKSAADTHETPDVS